MEPQIQNNNTSSTGSTIALIVLVLLLIIGGFYFWTRNMATDTEPVQEEGELEQIESELEADFTVEEDLGAIDAEFEAAQ